MSEQAGVRLWGRTIGAVLLEDGEDAAVFQYTPEFAAGGIEVSPLTMPLRPEPYAFPTLAYDAFKGLPGMLADSLPDRYGNALINRWLARQGRPPESASAVERLCYMGIRGMGALEFAPTKGPDPTEEEDIQVAELVSLASGSSPSATASRRRSPRARRKTGCSRSSASACRRAARGRRR